MIFNTYWFVFFVCLFFPVYWLLRWPGIRGCWLLAGCVIFHTHFAGPAGVIPIIFLGVVTYASALSRQRRLCAFAIALCVASLAFYKYTYFLCRDLLGIFSPQLAQAASSRAQQWLPAAPPLAISFFAFEFVHYLVEIYRGQEPVRRLRDFTVFAIFFPSLVAGPIKRYRDFIPELHAGLARVAVSDVAEGLKRVAIGAFKKLVIADNLTLYIKFYEGHFTEIRSIDAWELFAALAFRILFDFSGYSDMAIGCARMMGIGLPENFNNPYIAKSVSEFWQRWHISLSTWIRDYVYIPLGGNRLGLGRKLFNGVAAFALCGIWHGPAWHFVLWGLWHGAGLAVNSSYRAALGSLGRRIAWVFEKVPLLGWSVTLLYVWFGWLLFFYEPARAWTMAVKLLSFR